MRLRANLAADAVLVLVTLVWGSTFVFGKDILDRWPPISYMAARLVLAAALLALLFRRQLREATARAWKAGAVLGVLIGAGLAGQATGLAYTTPAKSAFISGLTTPLVPFVAYLLLRARPSRENLAGIILASIGGALILAPAEAALVNAGDLITLSTTVLFAAHISLMSAYARRYDVRQLSALQVTTAAALILGVWLAVRGFAALAGEGALPQGLAREAAPLAWSPAAAWQLVYLSLVATVGTFMLWTWGQARMSATHAAVIFSLEPVFATLFAVLVRGSAEWTGGRATAGAVLIVAGVIVSELSWDRSQSRERQRAG